MHFRQFVRQPLLEEQELHHHQQQQQQQQQQQELEQKQKESDMRKHTSTSSMHSSHQISHSEYATPMRQPGSSNQATPLQDFGLHAHDLPSHDTDLPPRPHENLLASPVGVSQTIPPPDADVQNVNNNQTGLFDLEKELAFGLDRKYI